MIWAIVATAAARAVAESVERAGIARSPVTRTSCVNCGAPFEGTATCSYCKTVSFRSLATSNLHAHEDRRQSQDVGDLIIHHTDYGYGMSIELPAVEPTFESGTGGDFSGGGASGDW